MIVTCRTFRCAFVLAIAGQSLQAAAGQINARALLTRELYFSRRDGQNAVTRKRTMAKHPKDGDEAIKPICVLVGQDAYLLDAARREVVAAAIGEGDVQTHLSRYDGDVELSPVLDELRTPSLLGGRRAVVVSPADDFVSAHREALEKYLEKPSSHAVLVLEVASWDLRHRLAKAVARVGRIINCTAPEGGSLARWIAEAAGRRGKKIDRGAAELLEECVGRDYGALDAEIEKLSLYAGPREAITAEDVEAIAATTAGPEAFALANALAAGDAKAALEALGGMLTARGDEFRALGLIGWHLRRVLAAAEKVRAGAPPEKAVPGYLPPGPRAALLDLLRRRSPVNLAADLRRLLRADLAMKSGADPQTALTELVVGLCTAATS
jgi:DNA polymerase-3 subunit delta